VDGAVVDDPEHPLCRGVGLGGHHPLDESVEGVVADLWLVATEHPASWVVDVHRGQPDRHGEPVELAPEPSWGRVADQPR
jgi:hypothetical protein